MSNSLKTDIKLGERYRDEQTGFEGIATSITFYQYACERIGVETYDVTHRKVVTEVFDAPRLTSVATSVRATTKLTGGPGDPNPQHRIAPR